MKTRKGRGAVLVIDDNDMVLETSTALLKCLGYTVFSAVSGEDALERYADKLNGIDLAIIDMVMPGMDGGECHARIRSINPDHPCPNTIDTTAGRHKRMIRSNGQFISKH